MQGLGGTNSSKGSRRGYGRGKVGRRAIGLLRARFFGVEFSRMVLEATAP